MWEYPACLQQSVAEMGSEMGASCGETLELRIPADTRYISLVRRGVRNLAESAGFTREDVADVEVAVGEAVTNSVVHGSPEGAAADVVVKCRMVDDCLVVEVEDQSPAEALPAQPDRCDPSLECGRGVLMMRALMDECHDCRTERGIKITMAKQRTVRAETANKKS